MILSVCIASCATHNSSQVRYTNIQSPGVYHIPIVADLDVKQEKVIGKSNSKEARTSDINILKRNALADALLRSSADLLVEPTYSMETNSAIAPRTVTVSGWPANYKNFRQMRTDDKELIEMGLVKEMTTEINSATSHTRKKEAGIAITGLAAGVGLGVLGVLFSLFY